LPERQCGILDLVFFDPRVGDAGEDDARWDVGAGDGKGIVWGLSATKSPDGALDVAGLKQMAVNEMGTRLTLFR
jgi:hypothetical protein